MEVHTAESGFVEDVVHHDNARGDPGPFSDRSGDHSKWNRVGHGQVSCVDTTEGRWQGQVRRTKRVETRLLCTSTCVVLVGWSCPDGIVAALGNHIVRNNELPLVASDILIARTIEALDAGDTRDGKDIRRIDDFDVSE